MSPAISGPSRIPALDFTKGALVLIMVLYHWLNYFVSTEGDFYRYLRFLTPSFIFITGFLISHVYLAAYKLADSRLPMRLMQRGLKLLAVFVVLNVARTFLMPDAREDVMPSRMWSVEDLTAIFVTGNVATGSGGKASSFNILVPISYLLLLSALLSRACRVFRYTFHLAALIGIVCLIWLRIDGIEFGNLDLMVIGLVGVMTGYVPIEKIDAVASHKYPILVAYLSYTTVIAVLGINYPLQVAGVVICLLVIYMLGQAGSDYGAIRRTTSLLGKYSLFGYIAQIAILQVLYRAGARGGLDTVDLVLSFMLSFALTITSVVILDRSRARLPIVDRLYKAVFA